jgi:hypothetical protein
MQGYLSGRGINSDSENGIKPSFRPFLEKNTSEVKETGSQLAGNPESTLETEVIFDEANCPKVEVVSEDNIPQKIVIHLEDGRLLTIGCQY